MFILFMYIRSVHVVVIKSIELLDWIQEISLGALSAVLGKLVSLTLFIMLQITSWYEPRLW